MTTLARRPIQIWAGLECTFNRVNDKFGDRFADQCALNKHDSRAAEDLRTFAKLGVKRLRYPVLWEKVAPEGLSTADWTASDLALNELRALDIMPIAGLVHHGSGPRETSLLDPQFPEKLATYALEVAKRYPWIDAYTPVNEPLTTARFSGLYGFWYPHKSDDASFVRALYNELKGTVLAMRAIRSVNPSAMLVQTEDLGLAKGTPPLQYQVDFENMRRWLTFDFLCGRIDERHYMFRYLMECGGLSSDEILWFRENSFPPDVIGINHYPLSNRFLDHRLELYPDHMRGGNGREAYADVGAVDCGQVVPPTATEVLREVWERYRRPFAVTEAHIAGPREAQMRWLKEIWSAATAVYNEGADIRAVTAWSLLGSYGWSSLCTCEPGHEVYESGVFDNRMAKPRATALAKMIQTFANGETFEHPLLERGGYWTEPSRVLFAHPEIPFVSPASLRAKRSRPVLITGANGQLGRAFARICQARGIDYVALDRSQLDISDAAAVSRVFEELKPWAVINAAGFSRIERAESDQDACYRTNTDGARLLAEACAKTSASFLTFSSDHVFNGDQREPYSEDSLVSPLNVYGLSKAAAERAVARVNDKALIVRTSMLFGPWDKKNFLSSTLRSLRSGQVVRAVDDVWASPTYVPDLVNTALDLLIDGESGIRHLTNDGALSWSDFAKLAADHVNADRSLIVSCRFEDFQLRARRPSYSVLRSERLSGLMPNLERALHFYVSETLREGLQ